MKRAKEQVLAEVHDHNVNLSTRDIYLHSHYANCEDESNEPGVEYRQATTFIKNLHILDLEPHSPILVHLHSIGGCWDNGMAIFNSIEFARSRITMLAYAQASSMSGIVFQSANLRIMMPDCHFMMHHGWAYGGEQHPFAFKNDAQRQINACKRMLEIFANRAINGEFFKKKKSATVKTAYDFFDKKIKKEVDWYVDSGEAVFYGLTDAVLGSRKYPDVHSLRGA